MEALGRHESRALAALGIACAAIAVAYAETRPQISIKTRAIDIAVTVDADLHKHPGLFEDLLAEGKRRAERQRAQAAKALRAEPEFFTEGRGWTFDSRYSLRSVVGRYVSVVRGEQSYTGGAHGNSYEDTILWDRETRKRMNIRPFFHETADHGPTMQALARLAQLAVAVAKIERMQEGQGTITPEQFLKEEPQIYEAIQPTLLKIGPISLTPSTIPGKSAGLTFHYSPYAVGSYAEGPYTVVISWTGFKQFLSPQGAAIFDGERPKDDDF